MAEGPLSFATGYKQYDDLLGQAIADNQARLSAAPTSPLSNVDPVMLSLAQGLLSPTKTGGFGESLGIAANAIQAPLAAMQKQKLDAQGKIDELQLARAKLAMEAPLNAARAANYGSSGKESIAQQRIITTQLLEMIGTDFYPDTINPATGQPFADEAEWKGLRNILGRQLYDLGIPNSNAASNAAPNAAPKETPKSETDSDSSKDTPKDDSVPPRPDARRGTNPETGKEGWFIPDPNRKGYYLEVQ
jgi:hypothetical protein